MDSMRRPVGHLPSTVYWRRRVVVLLALALLIALVAWACTAGGDSDDKKNASDKKPIATGSGSPGPSAITPGPNPTNGANPPIPGGGTGTPGAGSAGASAGTAGQSAGQTGQSAGQSAGSAGSGGTTPGGGAPGGGKAAPPAGGNWCTPSMIRVQIQPVESGKSAYNASQNVALKLIVTNESGPTCYVDLAPSRAYIEVLSGSERLWSSADCAAGAPTDVRQLQQGAAQAVSITRDWAWTRSNAGQCATNGGQTKAAPADKAAYRAKGTLAGLEPSGEFVFTATVGK
ncbi:hypothetical protein ACFZBU_28165 [Embleya sp. NPDC008237]|uniref:hypothetical protein n=1 Tax=unclassified Embleya TaxID=2699296 RepID=UPI0036EE4183